MQETPKVVEDWKLEKFQFSCKIFRQITTKNAETFSLVKIGILKIFRCSKFFQIELSKENFHQLLKRIFLHYHIGVNVFPLQKFLAIFKFG